MAFRITSNGVAERVAKRLAARATALYPACYKIAALTARMAARRAPVGSGRGAGALKKSLNCRVTSPVEFVLQSPLAYAAVQHYGRTVTAGTGPLGSRLLAIPLNDTARRMLDSMGASVSLRTKDLVFVRTRRGRMLLIQPIETGMAVLAAGGVSGRKKKVRGAARQHRMYSGQILFLLVPRVRIPAQPYAPSVRDPEWRAAAARVLREHLTRA